LTLNFENFAKFQQHTYNHQKNQLHTEYKTKYSKICGSLSIYLSLKLFMWPAQHFEFDMPASISFSLLFSQEKELFVHRAEIWRTSWILRGRSNLSKSSDLARPNGRRHRQRPHGLRRLREGVTHPRRGKQVMKKNNFATLKVFFPTFLCLMQPYSMIKIFGSTFRLLSKYRD